jgi:creatinine amidohydrolase
MRPEQVRKAIARNWPVILPVGVLEYHGEHLPLGMDGLVAVECLARLEAEMDLVILPPFWYGAASYAVAGPEGTGSLHVDAEALVPVARQVFAALLRVGFRNIHFVIHHQTEKFAQGMPTDLAFRLAARQAVFAHLERERGEGWWGRPEAADYYAAHEAGDDPFSWIKGHPLLTSRGDCALSLRPRRPGGDLVHAGALPGQRGHGRRGRRTLVHAHRRRGLARAG